jgi:ribosomal protein S18 acetylase RimI-like enzyme
VTTVRRPEAHELEAVQAVGLAAGRRFATVDDPRIAKHADDPPFPLGDLAAALAGGRLLVAEPAGATGRIVGFVIWEELDGRGHVEEVSVDPAAQGQGIGSALLDAVASHAAADGLDGVTLTTFRDVPWNRPFYERRGFRVLDPGEIAPGLSRRIHDEAAQGLAAELRVAMWQPPAGGAP